MFSMIEAKNVINILGLGNWVTVLDRICEAGTLILHQKCTFEVLFNKPPSF